MSMLVTLSPELSAWILNNLDRGCAEIDIVRSMVAQRFEPGLAAALVDRFTQARRDGLPPPSGSVEIDVMADAYVQEPPRLPPGALLHTADREVPVLMRLRRPALALLGGVLSAVECAALIELARDRLTPSTVVDPLTGQDTVAAHRSSDGMFFRPQETPFIAGLERRLATLMNCPIEHGEGLQVLRYRVGAHSAPHVDFLLPAHAANQASLARSGQRVASLVIYLNDVTDGGETVFPEAGMSVVPRAGHAVHFEYANSLGQTDERSVHAAEPVRDGEKWVATKWVRERPFVSA